MASSRREFLAELAVCVAGARVDALLMLIEEKIIHAFADPATGNSSTEFDAVTRSHVKTLFSDRADVLKLIGGRAHYQYGHAMHPDDRWACGTINDYANQLAAHRIIDPDLSDSSVEGSFVCMGSPVSNLRTRQFLEYEYIDIRRPELGLRRLPNPRLKLPFAFLLERKEINRTAKQATYKSEAARSVPNWSILTSGGHIISPNVQAECDLLLISRIPNWIEKEQGRHQNFGNTVTIFSGTHGVGTAAIRLVLSNRPLLERVLLAAANFEYWQVLMTVNAMSSEMHPVSKTRRFIATSLNDVFDCRQVVV
jgi:hypothetical protein